MTQQPNAADNFLTGGGIPSAFGKDDPIGTTITGVVCEPAPTLKQQTDIATGKGQEWDNGDPKTQLVVTIQTDKRDPAIPNDDGRRRLYVKGSSKSGSRSLHDAVASAVRATGARGLAIGGTLTVQFAGTEPSTTRGFNDRKLYAASYQAPDPALASSQFLGAGNPAPTFVPTTTLPAPTPPATPPGMSPEQLAAFEAWKASQQPA